MEKYSTYCILKINHFYYSGGESKLRISAVIQLARQYVLLGIVGLVFAISLFLFGYFVVYKKILKGTKKLNIKKVALFSIFFIYIVVVLGATLVHRMSTEYSSINMHLFSSYKEAWNNFSSGSWRNIILNILMFVPLGILLPLTFKSCKKYWLTYLMGIFFTLFIEIIQLISGRGIFELDDIFNNALGCIIGYGIVMIFISYFHREKKEGNNKKLILFQVPLCITVIASSVIFISYSKQELGNLACDYSYKQNMSKAKVATDIKFKSKSEKVSVYKAIVGTKDDALKVANEILSVVNTEVDESQNNVYDNTIVFKSKDKEQSVWVYYTGLKTWYIGHFEEESGQENLTYDEVKAILDDFNIELPEKADFTDEGDGRYTISVDMINDDEYINGSLMCSISKKNTVTDFTNNIISYKKYKEHEIISEKEAYEKLLNGEFNSYSSVDNSEIKIKDIDLIYETDSKGFYQPIYRFTIEGGNLGENIFISALK